VDDGTGAKYPGTVTGGVPDTDTTNLDDDRVLNNPPVTVGTIANRTNNDGTAIAPLNITSFFNDPNGDTLTYSVAGLPTGLALNPTTGVISGTINRSASQGGSKGVYTTVITANDGRGGTTSQTFSWQVNNPLPIAVNDRAIVAEDRVLRATGNLMANDRDPDGDPIAVINVRGNTTGRVVGTYGTLAWGTNGSYTYTLNNALASVQRLGAGQAVNDVFAYTIRDRDGATARANLTVAVNGTNDAPVRVGTLANRISNDGATIAPLNITSFFRDPDASDTLTYSVAGLPTGLALNPTTGVISGTINRSASQGGSNGVYTTVITANDGKGGTTSQTFSWRVNNPLPIAVNDRASVAEDRVLRATGNLMANDRDPDGDPISVINVKGNTTGRVVGTYGTLTWLANGSYTYTLNNALASVQRLGAGQAVNDVFAYTIRDRDGATARANLTVAVNGTNDAPVRVGTLANRISNDGATIVPLNITSFFRDPDASDTLTYSVRGLPTGLRLNPTTGVISGTLDRSASRGGSNGVYTTVITANDGKGGTTSQTFSWRVNNPLPIAVNDRASVAEDRVLRATGNLMANDRDPDGDPIAVINVRGNTTGRVVGTYGTLTWLANGSYTYTLNNALASVQRLGAGQTVNDVFAYTIRDQDGATATANLTVAVNGTNDAPSLDLNGSLAGTGHAATYNPVLGRVAIAPTSLRIVDADSPRLAAATITLTNRPNGTAERLVIGALPAGITASAYNPTTGQLVLRGLASAAAYQSAIAAITYRNTALYPNRQNRTIRVVVNDGLVNSNMATTVVQWASNGFYGTPGNDIINGTSANGSISGLSSTNVFYAGAGDDIVNGGSNVDLIYGGTGNDILNGGGGNDRIYGEAGDDILNGGSGDDYLDGGPGNDILNGGSGNDTLIGGAGNDILNGGTGNDILIGGPGRDRLTGGQGRDIFRFNAVNEGLDTITDFEILQDRIDLRQIAGLRWGNVGLQQRGSDTLFSVTLGGQTHNLATLLNVNANTLSAQHFVLPGQV
jgi:VCBS repeat-containing protein